MPRRAPRPVLAATLPRSATHRQDEPSGVEAVVLGVHAPVADLDDVAQVRVLHRAGTRSEALAPCMQPQCQQTARRALLPTCMLKPHAPKSPGTQRKWSAPALLLKKGQCCLTYCTALLACPSGLPTFPAAGQSLLLAALQIVRGQCPAPPTHHSACSCRSWPPTCSRVHQSRDIEYICLPAAVAGRAVRVGQRGGQTHRASALAWCSLFCRRPPGVLGPDRPVLGEGAEEVLVGCVDAVVEVPVQVVRHFERRLRCGAQRCWLGAVRMHLRRAPHTASSLGHPPPRGVRTGTPSAGRRARGGRCPGAAGGRPCCASNPCQSSPARSGRSLACRRPCCCTGWGRSPAPPPCGCRRLAVTCQPQLRRSSPKNPKTSAGGAAVQPPTCSRCPRSPASTRSSPGRRWPCAPCTRPSRCTCVRTRCHGRHLLAAHAPWTLHRPTGTSRTCNAIRATTHLSGHLSSGTKIISGSPGTASNSSLLIGRISGRRLWFQ